MGTKTLIVLLIGFALVSGHLPKAQQPKKTPRIGFLSGASPIYHSEPIAGFRQGLRDLNYVEGQNIIVEYRYAEGKYDRLPDLAAELVRYKVDVIVAAGGSPAIQAAGSATPTIPIIMAAMIDPIAWGFIVSFDRPGGNITGLSLRGYELFGKRLELLKEIVPKLSRVAVFWNPRARAADLRLKETEAASQALGLQLQPLEVQGPNDFGDAFKAAVKGRAGGFTVGSGPLFTRHRKLILDLAEKNRLPAIYPWKEYVEDGGLMSYAPNLSDHYRRAA
ncbi:MAG TPA: ABC transporter substrate-binding protein, partial [Candidatus Binatia bacterium]|nr:ABC transporter substrate-binding protein [Candidatus Binatia bacterium]